MKKRACACVCQKKVVPLQPVFEQKNNEKTRVRLRMSKKSCTFAAGFRIEN